MKTLDPRYNLNEYDKTLAKVLIDIYKNHETYIETLNSLKYVLACKSYSGKNAFESCLKVVNINFEIEDIQDICYHMNKFRNALDSVYKKHFDTLTGQAGIHIRSARFYIKRSILYWKLINYLKVIQVYDDVRNFKYVKDRMKNKLNAIYGTYGMKVQA